MMVEIEQVSLDLADVRIKTLDSIDPTRTGGWCPDVPAERAIFLEEEFANFGDTVQFIDANRFCLNLFTELPHKAAAGLHNRQAWMIFGVQNIKPVKRGVKCEMFGNIIVSMQNYLCELEDGKDSGYIQFYSLPEIVRCDGVVYKRHSVMHVMVYRNQRVCRVTPSVLMVQPSDITENLYVSLVPGQQLQIITPAKALVDASTPKLRLAGVDEKTLSNNARVTSTMLACDRLLERGEIITITMGRRRAAIWLTGLISSETGELYPFFNKPDRKTNLICHNMAGFVIINDADPNWLIDDFAEIRQGDDNTVVTFTKPQKSVSIEQTEGYWWLNSSQAHVLDAVT
jgi:hypothetical protein